MNIIEERLSKLRKLMIDNALDFYLITISDYHQSEFISDYFKTLKYMSGFTGSAGTLIVAKNKAYLWTDGRYFIQAEKELENSSIILMKSGEDNVPSIFDFIIINLKKGMKLGFDGRTISAKNGLIYKIIADGNEADIVTTDDLVGKIWPARPEFPHFKVFTNDLLKNSYPSNIKLNKIRKTLKSNRVDLHLLSAIDDICWTLNIRGSDIPYSPLCLCHALIGRDFYYLYIDEDKLSSDIKDYLSSLGIEIREYSKIYEDIKLIDSEIRLMLDMENINYLMYQSLSKNITIIDEINPEAYLKSIKNKKEIENIKIAQLKDSIAHIKFMKWFKENIGGKELSEISVIEKLESIRASMGGYISPSFEPISASSSNGAIIHYSPYTQGNSAVKLNSFLLMDTGTNYYEGTTDITRTYATGSLSIEMKNHFTLVALSNLYLANAIFPYGCTGINLDTFARKPLWDRQIDFKHGTGHGLGNLLNVHEGPIGIRTHYIENQTEVFENGMIVTDEPGIYIENYYGIRLENELLVKNFKKNDFGSFLNFEILTLIPFDLDAINPDIMTKEEKNMLNEYHYLVFKKIKPHINNDEAEWLKYYTRPI